MNSYNSLKSIKDEPLDFFKGKRVLVRADLNVPEAEGEHDFLRVDALIPTLEYLLKADARIVVCSHREDGLSLQTISDYLKNKNLPIIFSPHVIPPDDYVGNLARTGVITIIENTRKDPREETNDPSLVDELVRGFDYFVQDAFSVCHRNHASVVGVVAKLPSYLGLQAYNEIQELTKVLDAQELVMIVGGAKFGTKLTIIESFLEKSKMVFIGGALAHSIYKSRGYQIGKSLFDASVNVAHLARHPKVLVPQYVIVLRSDGTTAEVLATEVGEFDTIVDAGTASFGIIDSTIQNASTVVWNGPLGFYEKGYYTATKTLAGIIGECNGTTIAGGGDTVSALSTLGLMDKFTFVSLAGGAMLDFLANGTLVGLDVLVKE